MENYKEIMAKEIKANVCNCCFNRGMRDDLHVHHIDGKHNNNFKSNLVVVCGKCHKMIHGGFSKRLGWLSEDVRHNIFFYRRILLRDKYDEKTLIDRIKYESLLVTNYGYDKKKCSNCGSVKTLKLITFDFVTKFDKQNKKNLGYYLCKKCIHYIH